MYPSQISQMTNADLDPAGGFCPGFMFEAFDGFIDEAAAAACIWAIAIAFMLALLDCRGNGVIEMLGCCDLDDLGPGV